MPTGYTQAIANGITFQEYALGCARAFGACIDMRDSPQDEPIPEEFVASNYHKDALEKAQAALTKLCEMGIGDVMLAQEEEYEASLARYKERLDEKQKLRKKYDKMYKHVLDYVAPSDNHVKFKEFMKNQIEISMDDCSTEYMTKPTLSSIGEWIDSKTEKAKRDVEYHSKELAKEQERVNERNVWIKQLRDSLANA